MEEHYMYIISSRPEREQDRSKRTEAYIAIHIVCQSERLYTVHKRKPPHVCVRVCVRVCVCVCVPRVQHEHTSTRYLKLQVLRRPQRLPRHPECVLLAGPGSIHTGTCVWALTLTLTLTRGRGQGRGRRQATQSVEGRIDFDAEAGGRR